MNRKKRIELILKKNLNDWHFDIQDTSHEHIGHNNFDGTNETHFRLTLTNTKKIEFKKLIIHRKINEILNEEFLSGMHSLEIKIED